MSRGQQQVPKSMISSASIFKYFVSFDGREVISFFE